MAKAAKEETKVTEMENKIEKVTKFLADNKIECFDIQKLEDEQDRKSTRLNSSHP